MLFTKREFLLAASATLLTSPASAQYDGLGYEWQVHEEVPGGRFWQGTWRRRGDSNIFDARWRDSDSGGIVRDVIEIQSFDGSSLTLFRHGNGGTYYGRISGRSIRGTASWYPPGAFWRARIR